MTGSKVTSKGRGTIHANLPLIGRSDVASQNKFNRRKYFMKNIQHKTYSIGEAARICGVTEKQIRRWEERGHIPSPQRVICGKRDYRQFTEEGFRLIRRIKEYLDEGFTLPVAAKKAGAEGKNTTEDKKNG
jgi:hypothetical protein